MTMTRISGRRERKTIGRSNHALNNMVLQFNYGLNSRTKSTCWYLLFLAIFAVSFSGASSARFHSWRGHIFISPANHRTHLAPRISSLQRRFPFRKNHEINNGDEEKTGSRRTAKHEISQILHHSSRPRVMARTAATAGLLHFLHSNREATRRAIYFWTRAGPMVIHYRFTQYWLEASHANRQKRDHVYNTLHDRYCHPCLDIILHLKGLYVKIGQVLSARPDFVPRQYVQLFATVQDAIPQWPIEQVEEIVQRELETEYGLILDNVFESIERIALGSASIGQCHKAVLKEPWGIRGRRVVAIKVMHPGAQDRFRHDFQVFKWLCRVALPGWKPVLQELERQVMTEFDYSNEASSLEQVRSNMAKTQYANKISIPQPLLSLCSKHLLVMELLEGKKLSDAIEDRLTAVLRGDRKLVHDFMRRKQEALMLEADLQEHSSETVAHLLESIVEAENRSSFSKLIRKTTLAIELYSLYRTTRHYVDVLIDVHGHQIFLDGCFNGDPHPGNVLKLSNGKLGLIDYGQTRRLSTSDRLSFARIVSALSKDPMNVTEVSEAMRACGFVTKRSKDHIIAKYGALFFDNDSDSRRMGCATPQIYLMKLGALDPLVTVPDAAVFVARTSWMFRAMGSLLDEQIFTAKRWSAQAEEALRKASAESS